MRKTGFIGLIIINILSVEFIVEFLYLLTYKLSEDHIETFFCAIRSKGFQNTLTILTMLLPTFVATYATSIRGTFPDSALLSEIFVL
jgi:hypothetical protein